MSDVEDFIGLLLLDALDEAEDNALLVRQIDKPKDAFQLQDHIFQKYFRLNKSLALRFIARLEPYMTSSSRSNALEIRTKVLTAIRFFASGSYQQCIALNKYILSSQPSVSRCLHEVLQAVRRSNLYSEWVRFPNNYDALNTIRQEFYEKHGFPGVIGCIDCTHVLIVAPKTVSSNENNQHPENIYVNRKNDHSINVQLICDARMRIINVNAKFPGHTNDQYIFNNSNVKVLLERLHQTHRNCYHLLGDSGYSLRSWIMTPLSDVEAGTPEETYNEFHKRTRTIIERVNGLLKGRWRCLLKQRILHYDPETARDIIITCCILHNMCIHENLEEINLTNHDEPLDGLDDSRADNVDNVSSQRTNPLLIEARRKQRNIIAFFGRI